MHGKMKAPAPARTLQATSCSLLGAYLATYLSAMLENFEVGLLVLGLVLGAIVYVPSTSAKKWRMMKIIEDVLGVLETGCPGASVS